MSNTQFKNMKIGFYTKQIKMVSKTSKYVNQVRQIMAWIDGKICLFTSLQTRLKTSVYSKIS